MNKVLYDLDQFGKDVPAFNLNRKDKVNTLFGGTVTLALLILIVFYSNSKILDFLQRSSPNIRDLVLTEYYDEFDQYNLNEVNYRLAFAFEGEDDSKIKDDSRYVKMIARFWHRINNVKSETILNFHKCTPEDLNQFYPVANKSKKLYDGIMQDPERGFYCLDWTDEFLLYGNEVQDAQMIEIYLVPCNYQHTYMGYTADTVKEECNHDQQAQLDYLGPMEVLLYINDETYDPTQYGEAAIIRESKIIEVDINQSKPSYFELSVGTNQINDKTDYFQLDGYREHKFFNHGEKIQVRDSSWQTFPTSDNPLAKYKYVSFSVVRNPDFRQIFMTTKNLFDTLSEIGGLTRAVFELG